MMKMMVGYPDRADENEILQRRINRKTDDVEVNSITDPSIVVKMQKSCEEIYVDRSVREYMVDIVARTREVREFSWVLPQRVSSPPEDQQSGCGHARKGLRDTRRREVDCRTGSGRIILKPEHQIKGLETGEVIRDILHGKNAANVPTV